jgi:hypothetical protein
MRSTLVLSVLAVFLCLTDFAQPAFAKSKVAARPNHPAVATVPGEIRLGTFGGWNAMTYKQSGQPICYMVTTKTLVSEGPKRSAYLMITHRPQEGSTDVFSYGAGAALDTKKGAHAVIGKASFDLFAVRDIAWARDAQTDHHIATALRGDSQAMLMGWTKSPKGKLMPVSDQFDLKGASDAYRAIGKACGLPAGNSPRPPAKAKAGKSKPGKIKTSKAGTGSQTAGKNKTPLEKQ